MKKLRLISTFFFLIISTSDASEGNIDRTLGKKINILSNHSLCYSISTSSYECQKEALALLETELELYYYKKYFKLFELFLDCESPTLGMEVFIHEATHVEDIGIELDDLMTGENKKLNENKFSLTTLEHKKIPAIKVNSKNTNEVISNYLKTHYKTEINDENSILKIFLDDYIFDKDAYASMSFTKGVLTEWNAYIHGLALEYRVKKESPTKEILGQRSGILFFSGIAQAYLSNLKKKNFNEYDALISDSNIRDNINYLIKETDSILLKTKDYKNNEGSEYNENSIRRFLNDPGLSDGFLDIAEEDSKILLKNIKDSASP